MTTTQDDFISVQFPTVVDAKSWKIFGIIGMVVVDLTLGYISKSGITTDEPDGKEVMFKRALLNNFQEAFEGPEKIREEIRQLNAPEKELERRDNERMIKLRTLGNIHLIGEIFERKMVA